MSLFGETFHRGMSSSSLHSVCILVLLKFKLFSKRGHDKLTNYSIYINIKSQLTTTLNYTSSRLLPGPVEEPSCCIFNCLHTIKINNFRGTEAEMRLVKFFLEKAVELESLILVSPQSSYPEKSISDLKTVSASQSRSQSFETQSRVLQDQLSILPKASAEARIVLCEQGKDESKLCPAHTEYYVRF